MSESDFDQDNPYRSPLSSELIDPPPDVLDLQKLLRNFRSQIFALGVFWVLVGGFIVVVGRNADGLWWPGNNKQLVNWPQIIFIALGASWVVLGVLSCLKKIWAVYIGLALSYLSVIGNLINISLCPVVLIIVAIVQAHRVISWAKRLRRAGIPLTARP